jgi:hypothetical protein
MRKSTRVKGLDAMADAFWGKVEQTDGCWVWTGWINNKGYGIAAVGKKLANAHRHSWTIHNGPIPAGIQVLHHCDNRCCVNPDHLFLGTHKDNMADMAAKGRAASSPGISNPSHVKLTEHDVREMLGLREAGAKVLILAARFGVSKGMVQHICHGRKWAHIAA